MKITCLSGWWLLVITLVPQALFAAEPISPLESPRGLKQEIVSLGARLFVDARLSSDSSVSCNSCHDLGSNGADNKRFSIGVGGQLSRRNTPTVFNAAYNFRQFWDGRVRTLEEQVEGPLTSPIEMANTWPNILRYLNDDPSYRSAFQANFNTIANRTNVSFALAEFQRSLITTDSRFDQYLRGDSKAMTEDEQAGYELFKKIGCASCHQGRLVGGNLYEKIGIFEAYYTEKDNTDLGRFEITKKEENKFEFKVPSLRNVTKTPPYLHDGSIETLSEVIKIMARYQSGYLLDDSDTALIAAFLGTMEAPPHVP